METKYKTVSEAMNYGNTVINELRAMTKDFSDLCDKLEQRDKDEYIDRFIDDNQELIYNTYCEVNPENIDSDFSLEDLDGDYVAEFVEDYLEAELLAYVDKYKYGVTNE